MTITRDDQSDRPSELDRLTVEQVLDLVNQLAASAGVVRPAIAFLPWLDDNSPVAVMFEPGRGWAQARLDIDRRALDELSPAAWRHLLAHEIGHLKLHHHRFVRFLPELLEELAGLAFLAGLAWFVLREPSWAVGIGCALFFVLAMVFQECWAAALEVRADQYAVRVASLDHATADEVWDYLEDNASAAGPVGYAVDRLRRRHLHHYLDRHTARRQLIEQRAQHRAEGSR
jgi:Zn-dependent protease with chaperone function